jgi:hypothetical protein
MWQTLALLSLSWPLLLLFLLCKQLPKRYESHNLISRPSSAGGSLTCSEPQKLRIAKPFAERAKLKARLYNVLRESIYDDAKGIVNIAREKEIKDLVNKLKQDKAR